MTGQLFDLGGRTALVTGSSRGLGFAMAKGLAEAGADIVLNGVSADRLAAAAESLTGSGRQVHASAFDVSDETAVAEAFSELDRRGIAVDILVNNAGIQLRKPMLELSVAEWDKVLDTNLKSAFIVAREAAGRMIARGAGKIINIASVTGEQARATVAPYAVSKAGIKMLTRAMTAEWAGHNIQTNAIGPGYMLTDLNRALIDDPDFDRWVRARTPSRRWGRPEELVGAVVFLAAPASDYVSGQVIYVDGGMLSVL